MSTLPLGPLMSLESDAARRQLLTQARTIAVVGHSRRPQRPSYQIAQFLRQAGYRIYPVNPAVASIEGEPCYRSLLEVPEPIDLVNVFRQGEYLPAIVEEAGQIKATAVWAQLGVSHPAAAEKAAAAGILLIMDVCIKQEYQRLAIGQSGGFGLS